MLTSISIVFYIGQLRSLESAYEDLDIPTNTQHQQQVYFLSRLMPDLVRMAQEAGDYVHNIQQSRGSLPVNVIGVGLAVDWDIGRYLHTIRQGLNQLDTRMRHSDTQRLVAAEGNSKLEIAVARFNTYEKWIRMFRHLLVEEESYLRLLRRTVRPSRL